jgi:hypothetical protein
MAFTGYMHKNRRGIMSVFFTPYCGINNGDLEIKRGFGDKILKNDSIRIEKN